MGSGPGGSWRKDDWEAHLPIIGWKIWYGDGSVTDSSQSSWAAVQREGVQVIVYYHPRGRKTVSCGYDEYTLPGNPESKLGSLIEERDHVVIAMRAKYDRWRPAE